jgi:hypothetical protein
MRDPDTTFDQLKSLRLVCRSFNYAAAPRVLHCVWLFGLRECSMFNTGQLQAIVPPDLNGNLYVTKTLIMGNWRWPCTRLFFPIREAHNSGVCVYAIIVNSTVVPLLCLLTIIFAPHLVRLYIYDCVAHLRTRHRFSRASVLKNLQVNMPNVRRVV